MATLLDLIQELGSLNEAKTSAGGVLPESQESRWRELRDFYEFLMAQEGVSTHAAARYSASEIRKTVAARSRLRVQTEIETVAVKSSVVHVVRIGNLSRGGVLLRGDAGLGVGTAILLHLPSLFRNDDLQPSGGQVVWDADSGSTNDSFRYSMGVEFQELGPKEKRSLDDYVVHSLESKLLSLSRDAHEREFIEREGLTL